MKVLVTSAADATVANSLVVVAAVAELGMALIVNDFYLIVVVLLAGWTGIVVDADVKVVVVVVGVMPTAILNLSHSWNLRAVTVEISRAHCVKKQHGLPIMKFVNFSKMKGSCFDDQYVGFCSLAVQTVLTLAVLVPTCLSL